MEVMLAPGGLRQEIKSAFPIEETAQAAVDAYREEKPFLIDYYVARNDLALASRLEKPPLIARRQ